MKSLERPPQILLNAKSASAIYSSENIIQKKKSFSFETIEIDISQQLLKMNINFANDGLKVLRLLMCCLFPRFPRYFL